MRAALERLAASEGNLTVLIVGKGGEETDLPVFAPQKVIGTIRDDRDWQTVYSGADVFVLPTVAEDLPKGVVGGLAALGKQELKQNYRITNAFERAFRWTLN